MQRLRANSMDAAAAANPSIITSPTSKAGEGEDPAARGRRNRDRERAKREAKRKAAAAAARAALGGPDSEELEDPAAEALTDLDGVPCKNKACVRRGPMEDKLLAKWEQVKTELSTKVKGVQKLRRSVAERERQRDAVLEEITALKEASEAEVAGAAAQKKHLQAVESKARRFSEETQRLEVELRKLRVRYQEEFQVRIPMPHGSIISEAEAWAAAAEAGGGALLGGEDQSPHPPPFVSDGLTVSFFRGAGDKPRRERRRRYEASVPLSGRGLGRPSKEHSGNFGRWGPEAREQWSCCLWDEKEGPPRSQQGGGEFGAAEINGGGNTRSSSAANGCEAVPQRPGPGGMTAADDVHLIWGGSQHCSHAGTAGSNEKRKVRHEAWGAGSGAIEGEGEDADGRELWKPMLASRIRGGEDCAGGAAWSLIRQRRRPQTANARMVGTRTATATGTAATGRVVDDEIPPEKGKTAAGFAGVGVDAGVGRRVGAGGGVAARHSTGSNSIRRRPQGSARPGSAPPPGTRMNRYPNHAHHSPGKRQSSLMSLRSARARAGWQRKRPLPVGSGNGNGNNGLRRSTPGGGGGGGGNIATAGGVAAGAWHSRSLLSVNGGGSTYSVYSKGEGRPASVTPVGDAAASRSGKENGSSRRL
eukprot:g10132.t1